MGNGVPLKDYLAARENVLSEEDVKAYVETLAVNEAVLRTAVIQADRDTTRRLSIQEQRENSHITSGHIVNFLRARNLSDKGFQQLSRAQYEYALATGSQEGGKK